MKAYPHFPDRRTHDLNGVWDFAWLGTDIDLGSVDPAGVTYTTRMPVPSCFDAYPEFVGARGTAVYRTRVRTTPDTRGVLECGGFGMWNRVFVDGVRVADVTMPYSGVSLEIPLSQLSEREIVIVSDNRFDRERLPLQEQYFDFYAYGGIFRPLFWHEVGARWIERVRVTTTDLDRRRVECTVTFGGAADDAAASAVGATSPTAVGPATDLVCTVDGVRVDGVVPMVSARELRFTLELADAALWSPESPVLHELSVSAGGDRVTERFGIRTVRVAGHSILVNESPVKLLGYCRHEAHPQFGPALPLQQLVQDVQLLRDQGCTFVRGSHYPQDQRFLDLCDEAGILVFEESLGWQQNETHFTNPRYCDACVAQTRLMARNSFNHPSVIMWGFLNEARDDLAASRPLYERLVGALREEDPSRPVTFATNHPFDSVNHDLIDVVCVNTYPGWYSRSTEESRPLDEIVPTLDRIRKHAQESAGSAGKPFIVSEIGAGAIYGWRDAHRAHWSEEYQSEYLQIVCREIVENDQIAGVALWQFCDARTYSNSGSLNRPRGFNNKGVLNEYRKPKLAYEVVKSNFAGNRVTRA